MSYYDKKQEDWAACRMEQHKAQVTAAWERRDTPRAFVRSLEDMGYILATGNRDYVLVDRYGNMNSLPKLIDDKKVRTKEVREFLGKDFPKDSLPTVDEARALAAGASRGDGAVQQRRGTGRAGGQRTAAPGGVAAQTATPPPCRRAGERRRWLTGSATPAISIQSSRRRSDRHSGSGYLQESRRIKIERAANRPKGLAEFLGRITGVALITQKVQQFRDATRYRAFLAQKKELAERQQREAAAFERKLALETLTMQRRLRALELVEQRERKSLEITLLKERRVEERERDRTPAASPSRSATHPDEFNKAAKKPIDLTAEFERASGSAGDEGEAAGGAVQEPAPEAEITIQRRQAHAGPVAGR